MFRDPAMWDYGLAAHRFAGLIGQNAGMNDAPAKRGH
jgi:hypothetical protein